MNVTEKVSPMHPDKVADRIAGALVDVCYTKQESPKCAFEVLIGHGACFITGETSVSIPLEEIVSIVKRVSNESIGTVKYIEVPQDDILASNQQSEPRCGDNGVFAGFVMPKHHITATAVCEKLYAVCPTDGKIVFNETMDDLTICWSNISNEDVKAIIPNANKINPIGFWTGGTSVDTGITGRKLASDFYGIDKPLGGGTMHGKDLSKADCSVNIYCFLKAQETQKDHIAICSIGDSLVNINGEMIPFVQIVKTARDYIVARGGFEKFAEWGLK